MQVLKQCLAIGVAGFLGALARFAVTLACNRAFSATTFPVGTLLVNLSGCFILGLFYALVGHRFPVTETTRLAIAVGFVGAYTTFSTLMYDCSLLSQIGQRDKAVLNLLLSVALGLLCVRFGALVARRF